MTDHLETPDLARSPGRAAPLGDEPIRVVLFCGRFLEPAARSFVGRIEDHPEIELTGAFAQGEEATTWRRLADLWRRRGLLGIPILAREAAGLTWKAVHATRREREFAHRSAQAMRRIELVPNLHAPEVLQRIRDLKPDLGLIYGSPILKPELFEIPRLGTLGIHHGRLPTYRGKKTTFWALYHDEPTAGVTIQRVNAGIDTGEVVVEGAVPVGGKSYNRVAREVQDLGIELYVQAILAMKRGTATFRRPSGAKGPLYRDPTPMQMLRLPLRRLLRRWQG
jgi:folate-dependent phosphoribosylglycinamide formyltransferase PurN